MGSCKKREGPELFSIETKPRGTSVTDGIYFAADERSMKIDTWPEFSRGIDYQRARVYMLWSSQ